MSGVICSIFLLFPCSFSKTGLTSANHLFSLAFNMINISDAHSTICMKANYISEFEHACFSSNIFLRPPELIGEIARNCCSTIAAEYPT